MNRNYIFLTILMIVLAFGTILLSKDKQPDQIDPQQLLSEMVQPTRYISTDQIAKQLIAKDPSLMLMDVRDEDSYSKYSLPGAISFPIDSLMNSNYISYLGIPGTKVVFYSNDDIKADQAWVLAKRLGYNSIYVLKGGLNCWMETIIDPIAPETDASYAELEAYSFRKGAQIYFTGAGSDVDESAKVDVQVKRREKSSVAAGGC